MVIDMEVGSDLTKPFICKLQASIDWHDNSCMCGRLYNWRTEELKLLTVANAEHVIIDYSI